MESINEEVKDKTGAVIISKLSYSVSPLQSSRCHCCQKGRSRRRFWRRRSWKERELATITSDQKYLEFRTHISWPGRQYHQIQNILDLELTSLGLVGMVWNTCICRDGRQGNLSVCGQVGLSSSSAGNVAWSLLPFHFLPDQSIFRLVDNIILFSLIWVVL